MFDNGLDVSKMRGSEETFRVIERESEERFRTNRVETADRFNVRKKISMREPSISKKNDMIISICKKISTERDTRFN